MVSSKKKGQKIMQQFLPVRKAFLIAALVFVLNYVLGTAVVLGIATLIVQRRAQMRVAIP